MSYETCPECDAAVIHGHEHDDDCIYVGHDRNSLAERKESWDRQAAYERWSDRQRER